MRDILVAPGGKQAWVSNLGRSLAHRFDIEEGRIIDSVLVGRHPNSIRFLDEEGKTLLVSCRGAGAIAFVNTDTLKVIGRSAPTSQKPTGLAVVSGGFLVTSFSDGTLDYHQVRKD
jgi:DNA-binding beta-propeller fold protein YncE